MRQIADAIRENDWAEMKQGAHSLKGASGYVGASHIHYACYYIQEAYQNNQIPQMLARYPTLVEAAIEFKRFSRRILAQSNGAVYEDSPSARTTEVAPGFEIRYCPQKDFYYCLKQGQTLEQRKMIIAAQPIKPPFLNNNIEGQYNPMPPANNMPPVDQPDVPAEDDGQRGLQIDQNNAPKKQPEAHGENQVGNSGAAERAPEVNPVPIP